MNEQTQIDLPVRKHLAHVPPVRVSQYAIGAPYFITICADRMHYGLVGRVVPNAPNPAPIGGGLRISRPTMKISGPLTAANNAVKLLLALDFYRAKGIIFPRLAVVMPDHIHFIASFSESADMTKSIRNWKRWTAKDTGIVWQDEFFDHRLRNKAEITEKMQYVAMNPVRKGLCESPDDWPFRMTWC